MNFSEMSLHFGAVGALTPPGRLGLIGVTISGGFGDPLWPQNAKSRPFLVKYNDFHICMIMFESPHIPPKGVAFSRFGAKVAPQTLPKSLLL